MDKPARSVEREEQATSGRYVIRLDGADEAEMTWRVAGPGVFVLNHTFVPPRYRGQGIAERLMDAAIADARARSHKIVPLCSYVAAQFARHPEWDELRAE